MNLVLHFEEFRLSCLGGELSDCSGCGGGGVGEKRISDSKLSFNNKQQQQLSCAKIVNF